MDTKFSSSEQKLDDISRRIDLICLSVDKLAASAPRATTSVSSFPKPTEGLPAKTQLPAYTTSDLLPTSHDSDESSESELGDDVALASQATFATNFVETIVDKAHPNLDLTEVTSSLHTLKQSLVTINDRRRKGNVSSVKPLSPISCAEGFTLPPIQISMTAIQRLRGSLRLRLFWSMEFDTVGQFVEYLITVYSGKPSLADKIIVHCGLHRLFIECGNAEQDSSLREEFFAQGVLCRENLSIMFSSVPFSLPATFDFALALYMMSSYYLDASKLSRAWDCLVVASQMCQTLGYNREQLTAQETIQSKARRTKLFWSIYILDKMVSLRLNRHSSLRHDDITLKKLEAVGVSNETLFVFPGWAEIATLHGKIYDNIYSPGALARTADERDVQAREIAADLEQVYASTGSIKAYLQLQREAIGETICDILIRAERISQLSTLTLVYRGIRPAAGADSAFSPECLRTANQCLEEHSVYLNILKDVEVRVIELYVQWALLSAPFIPFIVIFCHVIETRDQTHLGKLSAVVETLQLLPRSLPDIYRKQLLLFKLMYDVACKYLNSPSNMSSISAVQPSMDMPFKVLYSKAGISLPARWNEQPNSDAQGYRQDDIALNDYGAELGYWFDQNHHIFEILEDTF